MIFKCKVCGGDLNIDRNSKIATCEYCGTKQTLPKLENEKIINLYDRANYFRRSNEYDKAEALYEMILNEDGKDAEAYWSLLLCEYGVEYVEDPKTHEYIPTCNRTQKISILASENYKQAIKYGEDEQKELYQVEAEKINNIQKKILEISNKEEPFDIFICYKEKDENGQRTEDSVIAQELYYQLQKEGFKVFFAKITLEDKVGESYEPYIYSALNSAKIMLVIGTKKEYFDAVWVKNEWSRYLALVKNGENKTIIPCYKGMDAYDLPEEFTYLQAQDMGKLGFEQDLIRGIKKLAGEEKTEKKKKDKPVLMIGFIVVAIIAIILTITLINVNKSSTNNDSTENKGILREDISSMSGYTFNTTLGELKDKIQEYLKKNNIDVIEVGIKTDDMGETDGLFVGLNIGDNNKSSTDVIGIVAWSDGIGEDSYITSLYCQPAQYGSGEIELLTIPLNLYEQAKKILGSETSEWKQLVEDGTLKEKTYYSNGYLYGVENYTEVTDGTFYAGMTRCININRSL